MDIVFPDYNITFNLLKILLYSFFSFMFPRWRLYFNNFFLMYDFTFNRYNEKLTQPQKSSSVISVQWIGAIVNALWPARLPQTENPAY